MTNLSLRKLAEGVEYRQATAVKVNVQAPVGGWNTRDSFDDIPPTDAIVIDNWIPKLGAVKVRGGSVLHNNIIGTPDGPDLVVNGDFETGDFTGWTTFGECIVTFSGSSFEASLITIGAQIAIMQQSIVVTADTRYFIKAQVKGDGIGPETMKCYVADVTGGGSIFAEFEVPTFLASVYDMLFDFVTPVGCLEVRLEFVSPERYGPTPADYGGFCSVENIEMYKSDIQSGESRIESLMIFRSGGDVDLIAAAGGQLFDVSTGGAPVQIGAGPYDNDIWDSTNFRQLLIMVNGPDQLQWDGSTLKAVEPNLPPGPNAPVGVHSFKNRNYYWDHLSASFWYTELYAPAGTTTEFDLSMYIPRGGHIIQIETWTHDGGTGPDDHLVVIFSSGTVVVYQGTSPASVSDWALVGLYDIGTPVNRRCTVKYGGDLMIVTTLDIVPMSTIMTGGEASPAISKISGAMETAAYSAGQFGWDAELYPREKLILFNIPIKPPDEIYQYVMNTITGAWAKLTGWAAYCWAEYEDGMYFGSDDGKVFEAFTGSTDSDGIQQIPIQSLLQSAWLTFGSYETKQVQMIRPVFRKVGASNAVFSFAVNFQSFPYLAFPINEETYGAPWGLTDPPYAGYPGVPWGTPWGFALGIDQDWRVAEGIGKYIGLQMKMSTSSPTELAGILWMLEAGTNL